MTEHPATTPAEVTKPDETKAVKSVVKPAEFGGPKGPDPTRYGDWEIGGKCVDF